MLCGVAVHSDMHACLSKPMIWWKPSTCAIISAIVYASVLVTLELLSEVPFTNGKGTLQPINTLLITLRRPITTSQKHKQSWGNLAVATALKSRLLL